MISSCYRFVSSLFRKMSITYESRIPLSQFWCKLTGGGGLETLYDYLSRNVRGLTALETLKLEACKNNRYWSRDKRITQTVDFRDADPKALEPFWAHCQAYSPDDIFYAMITFRVGMMFPKTENFWRFHTSLPDQQARFSSTCRRAISLLEQTSFR